MRFARFMSGPIGRSLRIAAGLLLVATGLVLLPWGGALIALGAMMMIVAIANICVVAALLHVPFRGTAPTRP